MLARSYFHERDEAEQLRIIAQVDSLVNTGCLAQLGRREFAAAERSATEAIAVMEAAPRASARNRHALLARAYALRGEARFALCDRYRPETIENDFARALRYAPDDCRTCFLCGKLRLLHGRYDEAEQDFTRALVLQPHFATALVARATVRRRLGNTEGMRADLEAARRLGFFPAE